MNDTGDQLMNMIVHVRLKISLGPAQWPNDESTRKRNIHRNWSPVVASRSTLRE